MRVSCTSCGGNKFHRPLSPGAGQKPVPHLYPYSVGWEARRPLEPRSQPRRGRGITCKKNVWLQSQKQRPRDKRVRAEDLKSLVVLGDEASHKGERNASSTKKQKENKGTPTLRCPKQSVCVLSTWSSEVASEGNHLLKPPASTA